MHVFHKLLVPSLALAAWMLTANVASAQPLGLRRTVPAQPIPSQPTPTQPIPPQPTIPQPQAPDSALTPSVVTGGVVAPAPQPADNSGTHGRFIRGRNLVGMNIWGPGQHKLGTVADFVVDYQGECPQMFFAVAPEIAGWSGNYLIVPFNAFQFGFDNQHRVNSFTLDLSPAALARAPRMEINKWNSAQDPQFFSNAGQFYQRSEHSAARPESGRAAEPHHAGEPAARQQEAAPRLAPAAPPAAGRLPEATPGQQPAVPATEESRPKPFNPNSTR